MSQVFNLRYRGPRVAFPHILTENAPRHEKDMEVEQEPTEVAGSSKEATPAPEEPPAAEAEPDAEKIKEQGNAAFKAGRYQDAIDHYSRAIGMLRCPSVRDVVRPYTPFRTVVVHAVCMSRVLGLIRKPL